MDARVKSGTRRLLFIVATAAALSIATWTDLSAVRANARLLETPLQQNLAELKAIDPSTLCSARAKAAYRTASTMAWAT